MAETAEELELAPSSTGGGGAAAALGALSAASRDRADAFLAGQSELSELQSENLRLQNRRLHAVHALELSHVRFRCFSDYAKFSLEIAVFLVVLLIVCGLATMVWNAAQDRDLVVDAFSVPPDIAQTGMTGQVLAGRFLDVFGSMENGTLATTQAAGTNRGGETQEVRLEIPETGVSIGELNRYLREWLGHETPVSGDMVRSAKGLALTLRYGNAPGITLDGGSLEDLIQRSAEHLFAALKPLRYGEYLMQHNRLAEASAVIVPQTSVGNDKERALAYADWAQLLLTQGDARGALETSREAVRLDSQNPTAMGWLQSAEGHLGHDEAARADALADIPLWNGPDSDQFDPALVAGGPHAFAAYAAELDGDFASAVAQYEQAAIVEPGWNNSSSRAEDLAQAHDVFGATMVLNGISAKKPDGKDNPSTASVRYFIALARGDWKGALAAGLAEEAIVRADGRYGTSFLPTFIWPRIAYAEAMIGDVASARATLARTPRDCDDCMRMRARIAGLSGDWKAMAQDFATVAHRSPHVPFAETDWGEMLLHKDDYDGAIAEFAVAHAKGPHFADPLEMWGEALIQKNRSDLALEKFEEANNYAANWGRLHLEWGKALFYAGKADDAQKQFRIASTLDLSGHDRTALSRLLKRHE